MSCLPVPHFTRLAFSILLFLVLMSLDKSFLNFQLAALVFAALLSNLPAKDLFERCAALPCDREAWRDFFKRYNVEIEATIRRIIGYPAQGRFSHLFDDIMQRFYQRLLENDRRALHALRGVEETQARAYLRTIAAGVVFKMIARELPQTIPLETSEAEGEERRRPPRTWLRDRTSWSEEAILLWETMQEGLNKILRSRNKYRNMLIFKLVVLDGFTPKEISRIPGLHVASHHAVEQLICRTRSKLRAYLKK